ncbi:MAG: hypothetical protein QGF34_02515, partial [Candidatus Poseidoniaceae archaeon]|nr:hypothetical protein [Candidatus Poseidoniaceae archaeon]
MAYAQWVRNPRLSEAFLFAGLGLLQVLQKSKEMVHVFPMFSSETRWYNSLVLASTVVPLSYNWPVSYFPQHRLVFLIDGILGFTTWFVLLGRVVDDRCIRAMNFSLF